MAACPVKTDPKWKELVEATSELEAYSLFIKNNYVIPELSDVTNLKEDISKISENERQSLNIATEHLREISKLKKDALDLFVVKYKLYRNNEAYSDRIEKLINQYRDASIDESFILLHNYIRGEVVAFNKKIKEDPLNSDLYDKLRDFLGAYGLSKDLVNLYQDYEGTPFSYDANFKTKLKELTSDVVELENLYHKNAIKAFAIKLAAHSTIKQFEFKEEYKREFRKNNPKPNSNTHPNKDERKRALAEYNTKEHMYIQEMLDSNVDEIRNAEEKYLEQILRTAPRDITDISKVITDHRNQRSQLLQITSKLLDNADFRSNENYVEARNTLIPIWEKFKQARNKGGIITNQRALYGEILEKDKSGNLTGYYTRRFFATYYDDMQQMWREYHALKEDGLEDEADVVLYEWKKKYVKPEFLKGNFKIKFLDKKFIKDEFINDDFDKLVGDQTLWDMYENLIDFNKDSDKLVPPQSRLGYKLPAISKSDSEILLDNKAGEIVKKKIKSSVGVMADDFQFGLDSEQDAQIINILKGQGGKPFDNISLPFRAKLDSKEQSFDLVGMALTNRYFSLNFSEKSMIKMDLEMIKDLVSRSTVKDFKNNKAVHAIVSGFEKVTGQKFESEQNEMPGLSSNLYATLDSMLQDRLYGKHNIAKNFKFLGKTFSSNKMADSLLAYSGNMMLMFNEMGGLANFANGMSMNFFEALRGTNFTRANLRRAEAKYFRPDRLAGIISDMGALVPTSFLNKLGEKFLDTSMDFNPMVNQLIKDNRFKRLASLSTLHYPNNIAEHVIQHTMLLAIMDNIKVMQNGNYVDINGNVTTRDKAATMDEMYTKDENGLLKFKEGFTIEGFATFGPEAEAFVRRKIKDVVADTQGQYDGKNKSMLERYAIGKLVNFLKKWIVRGAERELLGIEKAYIHKDKLKTEDQFYSESQQAIKEGHVTSLIRYLNMIRLDYKALKMQVISVNWEKLSDYEKGNIRAAVGKLSFMIGSITAASALKALAEGIDDDDEWTKKSVYTSAYIMRRLYGELSFFTPVSLVNWEFMKILRSPTATLSSIENIGRLLEQLTSDLFDLEFETYQSGRHRGKSKSLNLFRRAFDPFHKNLKDRDAKKSLEFLENGAYY